MTPKEATARIKINRLLEEADWRFFDDENGAANICLESNTKITSQKLDAMGENFEEIKDGYIDFLLLNPKGFPLIVLEAKSEDKDPLVGKEQARKYARSQNCRFVILSNGNLHYFWDIERGNPSITTTFPAPVSVLGYGETKPDLTRLIDEQVDDDYIVLTQRPTYASEAGGINEAERLDYTTATLIDWKEEEKLSRIIKRAEISKNDYNTSPGRSRKRTSQNSLLRT